jgi:deazaflavin-dependent oxidoreductase (nitroreductase family)
VVITTTGARSGIAHKTPVLRVVEGETYALIASLGGSSKSPNWYWNLRSTPVLTLQDGAVRRSYRAREVHDEERTEWWRRATLSWPLYEQYQDMTDRTIPVLVAEPAESRLVPDDMDATTALLAIEEIKQLKARYFRFVDKKNWSNLETLFTPACVFEFESSLPGVGATRYEGAAEFVRGMSVRHADTVAVHHGHTPEITLIDAQRARGVWVLEDIVLRPPGGIPSFHGWGHYFERYSRVDGVWKISAVRIERHRESLVEGL